MRKTFGNKLHTFFAVLICLIIAVLAWLMVKYIDFSAARTSSTVALEASLPYFTYFRG